MMSAFRYSLIWILMLWPAAAPAQPDTTVSALSLRDTVLTLPDVTVTATRTRTTTARAPTRVTVLDARALSQASSVAELLSEQAGLFIKQYGPGQLATPSLRGTGASQVLVLLDGHRIADPQLGQLDLSLLPTALLNSVEVMHGAGSPLYGTDAIGGVINLRTLSAGTAPRLKLSADVGAFDQRRGSILVSESLGRWTGLAVGEYEAAEGNFPYLNEARFPPEEMRRSNADRERTALYSSLGYRGRQHDARLSGWYTTAERGLPGLATARPTGERQWDEHLRLWADDRIGMHWGSLRLGGLLQHSTLRYMNPALDIDDTSRTLVSSLEAEAQMTPPGRWMLAAGVTGSYNRAAHPSLAADAREGHVGMLTYATGRFGPLLMYPALRADTYLLPEGTTRFVVSPRLSLNTGIVGRLRAKASAGRVFRMPTFNDRFWQPGGNPGLRPERGWSFDTGLFSAYPGGHAELSAFVHYLHDQIVWEPSGAGHYAPKNVLRTRTAGLEASLRRQWIQRGRYHLGSSLFYTFTDARDRSTPGSATYNEPLRYVPRQELKSQLHAGYGPIAADLSMRYTGRRHVTSDGSQSLDPFFVVDAQLRLVRPLGGLRLQLALQVENALNADYAVLQYRPMPPRHLRLRLLLEAM